MQVKEILVISGKGGTGKTTITSSLIPYFDNVVIGDCDVDAPNLKILFNPIEISKKDFFGMKKAVIDRSKCINCGKCFQLCKFDAIGDLRKCEGCGVCEYICPVGAIKMVDNPSGKLFISKTDFGTMVHASLFPGEENSGKLVSLVRKEAKKLAELNSCEFIILDGAPGLACNVISSLTGVKEVIIVTEPTLSGLHDLERVVTLVEKFHLTPHFIINKYDLSCELSSQIENFINNRGYTVDVKLSFDKKIAKAIENKKIPSLAEKEFFKNAGFEELVKKLKTS